MRIGFAHLLTLLWLHGAAAALAQPTKPPEPPKGPQVSAEAVAVLDRCLKKLGELTGYEVRFRQRAESFGLPTLSEGRIVLGPQRRIRYEMATRHGALEARTTLISDGTNTWRFQESGPAKTYVSYRLNELDAELDRLSRGESELDLANVDDLKRNLSLEHGDRGILPVLEDLKAKLVFTKVEEGALLTDSGARLPVVILEGEWNKDVRGLLIPPKPQPQRGPDGKELPSASKPVDPAEAYDQRKSHVYIARRARLYLDNEALLPVRLDWLGPKRPEGPEELLARFEWLEFAPKAPEQIAAEFKLRPEEEKLPIKAVACKEWLKAHVDALVQKQERERESRGRGQD